MAAGDTPSSSNSGIVQEFQQEAKTLTEPQAEKPVQATQQSDQLEDYTARNNDYSQLRDVQPLAEPTRPDEIRQPGYAQGQGDYVSETTAARKNDEMLNAEKQEIYKELAQEIEAEQKQDTPDRQQEKEAELGD